MKFRKQEPTRQERELEAQRIKLQNKARDILIDARANIHTGMNRRQRRRAARAAGIFKHAGLWAGIHNEDQKARLAAKTVRNAAQA